MFGWIPLLAVAAVTPFEVQHAGSETIAAVTLTAKPGTVASIRVDGRPVQHLTSWGGGAATVFLGPLSVGAHTIDVEGAVSTRELKRGTREWEIAAHAPIVYARPDTIGKFSDYPMIAYAERLSDGSLQYTVIFSNEDGGTSTRALMARWGRTTDIEFLYRVWPKADGSPGRTLIQAKDHKEIEFKGRYEGWHPVLAVSTMNNMVSDAGESAVRYQLAPKEMAFTSYSREEAMDDVPETYRAAAEELEREGKLRPYGVVDGQKVSDLRNYAVIEMKVANDRTVVWAGLKLRGAETLHRSHPEDNLSYAIERSGWVRTTVELPPGTTSRDVDQIVFGCDTAPRKEADEASECVVERVSKVFFLGRDYKPEASIWSKGNLTQIKPGGRVAYPLSRQ